MKGLKVSKRKKKAESIYKAIKKYYCDSCKHRLLALTTAKCPHYDSRFKREVKPKGIRVFCKNYVRLVEKNMKPLHTIKLKT